MNRQPGEPFGTAPQRERSDQTGYGADGADGDGMRGQAKEMAGRAEEAAAEGRERMAQAAHQGEQRAADGMEQAASALRERAEGTAAAGVAVKAADGMERSAGYLRSHDTGEMWGDVEHYVREHPVAGIAGSVAAGFIVGRILR